MIRFLEKNETSESSSVKAAENVLKLYSECFINSNKCSEISSSEHK